MGPRGFGDQGGDESYLASVSDLMVGMLFVFIIMLMAFALNFRSAEERVAETEAAAAAERDAASREQAHLAAERDALLARQAALGEVSARFVELEERRAELLGRLAADLAGREVPAALDAANGVLRLPESLLFESGEAALRPEGERALAAVASALASALPCHAQAPPTLQARCPGPARPLLEAVLVEGHTDDVPLRGGPFGDNWALSAARGVGTFKALTRFAPELESLRNARGEALLGVAGYEARRPVAEGAAPETRRRNRRIDLRFLVAAPSDAELAGIVRRLGGGVDAVP